MLKDSRYPQGVMNTDQTSTSKQISFCKTKVYLNANTKILHFESHLSKLLCSYKISVAIDVVLFIYNLLFGIFTGQCSLICTAKTKQTNNYTSCFITDDRSEWKVFNYKKLKSLKLCKVSSSKSRVKIQVRKKYLFTAMKLTAIPLYNIIIVWTLLVQCNLMSYVWT